ncbi:MULTISPECIES: dimethyl sulfoxide reductase anchor subunit family protein [unclassified Brenneria]|uniref:dimethyl sulfoxide reductase anchor subunit family protein n=1 Tax=unclassified Brenneria TaxID=2634434 RepID=UPI001557C376|nr:DmsC/YnfH family molybdoenzyme membrane anchor subunit [Brenneria sp. hezel4-2-4]MEE3650076.1 DmsC/YnfH family molybdoenzyme membrane anchor subunit [Brenneria sp. HEZEL_4_2_4]NPD00035.1 dimethyl sulfoxide reductase anchor subunit [Brenneria sp. hezel4-2-4]
MHELPLVFFTVFTQSAVGAFILLLVAAQLQQIDRRRLAVGLFAVMCLFGAALLVGTFHVGQPLRAINMLFRAGSSPMSNEIALSGIFSAIGGLAALGLLLNRGADRLFLALAWLAAVVGIFFLAAIPRVYQLPTVVTWDNHYTTAMMILTALIGGGALAAAFGARRLGLSVSLLAILVSFCLRPGYLSTLMTADGALTSAQFSWFSAQLILLAVGLIGGVLHLRYRTGQSLLAVCAAVVIVGELAGRVAFYNLWTLPM